MQSDLHHPFREINHYQRIGLISQMLEIQKYKLDYSKPLKWYQNTPYLGPIKAAQHCSNTNNGQKEATDKFHNVLLQEECIDPNAVKSALAVSYTWVSSEFEDAEATRFYVVRRDQPCPQKCDVRDSILSRVVKYLNHSGARAFWIDRECINQIEGAEKDLAMQSMDLIYRFGKTLACLTHPISTTYQARLLSKLMKGKWIWRGETNGRIELKRYVRVWQAREMITLLEYILSDPWWNRSWTYQEEFCASIHMTLLMPHGPDVNKDKKWNFGDVPGEIQLSAVEFRKRVTEFCLAQMRKRGERWQQDKTRCKKILSLAGEHQLINRYEKEHNKGYKTGALTWRVIDNLRRRKIENPWDILPIIANCCGYPARLDARKLQDSGYSLSAAVLALVILNGEVLHNTGASCLSADTDIFKLLNCLAFRNFGSMADVKEFTYLKRCRLVRPSICSTGILTEGCVWGLHRRISVPIVRSTQSAEIEFGETELSNDEIKQLDALCRCICHNYPSLTNRILNLMNRNENGERGDRLLSMIIMARNVVRAIQEGKSLAIGSLTNGRCLYGIFVVNDLPSHCFTAWRPRVRSRVLQADRYLEKNISLRVQFLGSKENTQRLKILEGVVGLCFFNKSDHRRVLLPWAESIQLLESRARE